MRLSVATTLVFVIAASTAVHAASQNDVIIGNGGSGPYALAWKNITTGTVSVSENTLTLTSGIDYTIDIANGQITFSHPLTAQTSALVQYQYDPTLAQRTSTQVISPLKVDLDESSSNDLYVSASVLQASATPAADTGGNVALVAGSTWKESARDQFGAHLYFDPTVNGALPSSPTRSASGFALNGATDAGRGNLLSFGFNRAEQSLIAQDGLQAGAQVANMTLHIAPETKVVADLGYRQTDSLDLTTQPDKVESTAAVTMAPSKALQVKAQFGQIAQTGQDESDTSTVSITDKPIASTPRTTGVDLTATATQTVQGTTSTQQTGVGVTVGQNKKIALTTGVNLQRADDVSHQVVSLSTTMKPMTALEFDAGYQDRAASTNDTNLSDSLDTTTMQLALKPSRTLKLTGNYDVNPADGSGTPTAMCQRGLGVESTFGRMSLTGGYNWDRAAGTPLDATSLKVGVDWKLSANGQFTCGYQQAIGESMTNTTYPWQNQYSLGYKHGIGDAMSISFTSTYNQHPGEAIAGTQDLSGNASVGLKF